MYLHIFVLLLLLIGALLLAFLTDNQTQTPEIGEISAYIRQLALDKSQTSIPVPILAIGPQLYNGLFVINAGTRSPVFELARMSLELKVGFTKVGNAVGAYKFRNSFDVITSSQCPVYLELVRSLAKPHAAFVCDQLLESATSIVDHEHWKVYQLQDTRVCTSMILFQMIYNYCKLDEFPTTIFYVSSQEREDEIREAYKHESSFVATNVTGLIHACVLKSMFPTIRIIIPVDDDPTVIKAREFFNTHFS